MKVAFSGDRNPHSSYARIICDELGQLDPKQDQILVGDCPTGVDYLVKYFAQNEGFDFEVFRANWKEYGRAAGPLRNRAMLNQEPDYLVAVHYDLDSSKGTKNCVETAQRLSIGVRLRSK